MSVNTSPVVIAKTEKDAVHFEGWDVRIIADPGELNGAFAGIDVVIVVPSNDDARFIHVDQIGAALAGKAQRIRVLLPEKLTDCTPEQLQTVVDEAPEWAPPPPEVDAEAKARAQAAEQQLIDELARLSPIEYEHRREQAAADLGARRRALDDEVQARRNSIRDAEARIAPPLFGHWIVEPWTEPVATDALLSALVDRTQRHVRMSNHQILASALFDMLAWIHDDVADYSPMLLVTAPEQEAGKSTLLKLMFYIVPRGLPSSHITKASVYHSIERYHPTLLIDEADTLMAKNEQLRAVINGGHTRELAFVLITERAKGGVFTTRKLSTFGPKAIGMKGRNLPSTTLSRCIVIDMLRKLKSERIEPIDKNDPGLGELRRQCFRWALDNAEALKTAAPKLNGRLGDNWVLPLAISDLAGGEWPERARQAAMVVAQAVKAGDESTGAMVLTDIKSAFETNCRDTKFFSDRLVELLVDMEGRPWAEWKGNRPLSKHQLAGLLKPFKIEPKLIRLGDEVRRGYELAQFKDAFARWL